VIGRELMRAAQKASPAISSDSLAA
jgi:hypothetical protein